MAQNSHTQSSSTKSTSKDNNSPNTHGQHIIDPLSHFRSIPWCEALLSSKQILHTAIPDRNPKPRDLETFTHETLNGPRAVRACVVFLELPNGVEGIGKAPGEDKKSSFLQATCLMELGTGVNSMRKTAHGGFIATCFDEIFGTVVNQQAGEMGTYTAGMTLRYKKPVSTPGVVRCVGKVVRRDEKKWHVEGKMLDKDGEVLAESEAVFFSMKKLKRDAKL